VSGRAGSHRARQILLALEAAFAAVLIVGASLLAHSFVRLLHVDPGYASDGVLTAFAELPSGADAARTARFVDAALPAVRALPGVVAAGAADMIPLTPRTAVTEVRVRGEAGERPTGGRTRVYTVTEGYAEAVGLRLVAGRFFRASDTAGRRPMIVNEEFIRQYLPRRPVIGLVLPGLLMGDDNVDTEVVGVVSNVLKDGNGGAAQPEIYLLDGAANRWLEGAATLVVRTSGDPSRLAPDLRRLLHTLDPAVVVDPIEPLSATLSASFARPRFAMSMVSGFALLALLLAAIGLYGVLSHMVVQRRRELGVRAALGATRGHLVMSVVREGLSWTVLGIGLGGLTAGGLAQVMRGWLFAVAPWDPVAFGGGALLLVAVTLAACIVPASRAAGTDPAAVLRGD
jgi:predicted permease